jgi:hypothetical protein
MQRALPASSEKLYADYKLAAFQIRLPPGAARAI